MQPQMAGGASTILSTLEVARRAEVAAYLARRTPSPAPDRS